MALFIGIDVGTSGCRAVAINEEKAQIESSCVLFPTLGYQEQTQQNPEVWWKHVMMVLQDLCTKIDTLNIAAIALDGTSGTVLITDRMGNPLLPALMYNDNRAQKEAAFLKNHAPNTSAAHGTSSGLAKIMWLKKQLTTSQPYLALHQSDWLYYKMGAPLGVSDYNNCLKSGYDPVHNCWPDWISATGLNTSDFPTVYRPGTVVGNLKNELASLFKMPKGTKLISGTTDSTAAFIATGATNLGDAVTSLGSTIVLKIISKQAIFDPLHGVYSQPYQNNWLVGGGSNSGGNVLLHYFTAEQLSAMTPQLSPNNSTGLSYYPLVHQGERFPINNPLLNPIVYPRPEKDLIFFQGLLEGMANIEHEGYTLLQRLGAPYPQKIYTVGGGHKNVAWTQMRKKLMKVPIIEPLHTEAAYGSALLALQGTLQK